MNFYQSGKKVTILGTAAILLSGCAAKPQLVDTGVVVKETFLSKPKKVAGKKALGAGLAGGGVGAGIGAAAGAAIGVGCSVVTLGLCLAGIPALATAGAAIGGATGAVVGGGTGYYFDLKDQGVGLYKYLVKPTHTPTTMVHVKQYSPYLMPKNTKVNIYKVTHKGKSAYAIRKIDEQIKK